MVYHRCLLCNTGSTKKKEMPSRKKRVVGASVKTASKGKKRSTDSAALNTSKKLKVLKKELEGNVAAYCWICHKVGQDQVCACKKGYHNECLGMAYQQFKDNKCPECELKSVDGTELTKPFSEGLKFYLASAVKWIKEDYKTELLDCLEDNLIVPAMDIETLLNKAQADSYKTTAEFYTDVKEFYHECCILYGENSDMSTVAKKMTKDLREELVDMEACPDCYYHLYCKFNDIYGFEDFEREVPRDDSFFVRLCDPPHDIVWAKVAGYSHWPAKVLKVINGKARVRFFGKHEKAEIPMNLIFHISQTHPVYEKRSLNNAVARTSIDYACAKVELMKYISLYEENIGKFKFFEFRMFYGLTNGSPNTENVGMPPTAEEVGPEKNNTQFEIMSNDDSIAQEPLPVSTLIDQTIEHFENAIAGPSNSDVSNNVQGLFTESNSSVNSYDSSIVITPILMSETLPVQEIDNNYQQSTPNASPTEVLNTSSNSISSSFSSESLSAISYSSAPTSSSSVPSSQDFQIKEEVGNADQMSSLPRFLSAGALSQFLDDLLKSSVTGGSVSTSDTFISSLLSNCASNSNVENAPSTSLSIPSLSIIKEENVDPDDSVPSTSGIHQPQNQVYQNSEHVANPRQKLPEKEVALIDLTEDNDEDSSTEMLSSILVENPQINNLYQHTHKAVERLVTRLCAEVYKRQTHAPTLLCNVLNEKILETEKKFHEETTKLKDEIKRLQRSLDENK